MTVDRALRLLGLGAPTRRRRRRPGPDASPTRCARRCGRDGPDDRLRPGRRGEHRRVRPARRQIADACEDAGAWLHVDGAFGIWAAVSPRLRHLVAGARARRLVDDRRAQVAERARTTPGIVFCAHPESHRAAMTITASYLIQDEGARRVRDQVDWVPEFSRRARGFAVYAALRSLGRSGIAELVERCCDARARFAERDRRARRRRGPERGRAQPGALPLRVGRARPTRCSRACRRAARSG